MTSVLRATAASLVVLGIAALATYFTVRVDYRSGWNLLWMAGVPLLMTFVFFRRAPPWIWAAAFAWLTICSFCTLAITAELLGAG